MYQEALEAPGFLILIFIFRPLSVGLLVSLDLRTIFGPLCSSGFNLTVASLYSDSILLGSSAFNRTVDSLYPDSFLLIDDDGATNTSCSDGLGLALSISIVSLSPLSKRGSIRVSLVSSFNNFILSFSLFFFSFFKRFLSKYSGSSRFRFLSFSFFFFFSFLSCTSGFTMLNEPPSISSTGNKGLGNTSWFSTTIVWARSSLVTILGEDRSSGSGSIGMLLESAVH
uniref:Uncharacterized protein n=1 Tax=Opuntia streptacantha TaxID=393608 RepID=A0A7C8ZB95_OPUST